MDIAKTNFFQILLFFALSNFSLCSASKLISRPHNDPVGDHNITNDSNGTNLNNHEIFQFKFFNTQYYYGALQATWVLGVILSLIGSLAGAFGDNLIRLSYQNRHEKVLNKQNHFEKYNDGKFKFYFNDPLWVTGQFLNVFINPTVSMITLKLTAASIVLPFAGMHIIWNIILAKYLLGERVSTSEVFSSLLILLGIIIIVLYGSHKISSYNMEQMMSNLSNSAFILYILFVCICAGSCCYYAHSLGEKLRKFSDVLSIDDIDFNQIGIFETWRNKFSIAASSGIFGGVGNILAKSALEILNTESFLDCILNLKFTFLFLTIITLCSLQLFYLNLALYRHEANQVVPIVNAVLVVFGSIGGLILFQEYLHLTKHNLFVFMLGLVIIVLGFFILLRGREFKYANLLENRSKTEVDYRRIQKNNDRSEYDFLKQQNEIVEDDTNTQILTKDDSTNSASSYKEEESDFFQERITYRGSSTRKRSIGHDSGNVSINLTNMSEVNDEAYGTINLNQYVGDFKDNLGNACRQIIFIDDDSSIRIGDGSNKNTSSMSNSEFFNDNASEIIRITSQNEQKMYNMDGQPLIKSWDERKANDKIFHSIATSDRNV